MNKHLSAGLTTFGETMGKMLAVAALLSAIAAFCWLIGIDIAGLLLDRNPTIVAVAIAAFLGGLLST